MHQQRKDKRLKKRNAIKYLGQIVTSQETQTEEIKRTGDTLEIKVIFLDEDLLLSLKRKVFDKCVSPGLIHGCLTGSQTKSTKERLRVTQRYFKGKMLKVKLEYTVSNKISRAICP